MYTQTERRTINRALCIIHREWTIAEPDPQTLDTPSKSRELMQLQLAGQVSREVFVVIFLNAQHRLIEVEEMFQGTIDGAAVYPREVARRALELNSSAVILGHNHPSGTSEPSTADKRITERLKSALALLDIRVLDHIIVGGTTTYSFAESGLI